MQIEDRGQLILENTSDFPITPDEAVSRYQVASSRCRHLTLIGKGKGSAICLMLASRFLPDEVILYPQSGQSISQFVKEVNNTVPFLYFVCAPITIVIEKNCDPSDLKRIKRLLKRISSRKKRLFFENDVIEISFSGKNTCVK